MITKNINKEVTQIHPIMIPFYRLQIDHYENIKKQAENKDNKDIIVGFLSSAQNIANPQNVNPRHCETVHYRDIASNVSLIFEFIRGKGLLETLCKIDGSLGLMSGAISAYRLPSDFSIGQALPSCKGYPRQY